MKFMMIVKASKESEAGVMPSEALLNSMAKYNEELMKAGVLLDLSGLQSSSKGARIKYSNGKRVAVVAPHETQDCEIELRQFFEMDDFAPSEAIDRHKELGKQLGAKK